MSHPRPPPGAHPRGPPLCLQGHWLQFGEGPGEGCGGPSCQSASGQSPLGSPPARWLARPGPWCTEGGEGEGGRRATGVFSFSAVAA